MSISSDQSRFTACLFGEALPEEQSAFDAALRQDASLREEAASLSRTAHRLAAALNAESVVSLTSFQRQTVLDPAAAGPVVLPKKRSRPSWLLPTLATAGIAAGLGVVLYAVPGLDFKNTPDLPAGSIPAVAIQPSPAMTPPSTRPPLTAPATGLARESHPAPLPLPEVAPPTGPIQPGNSSAITAKPPVITVLPPSTQVEPPLVRDFSAPPSPAVGPPGAGESLASPAPPKP